MSEIDCENTCEIVCPYCGHKHIDSWEMTAGEWDCVDCGKLFFVYRHVEITYSTSPVEKES